MHLKKGLGNAAAWMQCTWRANRCAAWGLVDFDRATGVGRGHWRRLHLAQLSMADNAFGKGLGQCSSLEALHLESQQECALLVAGL